LVKLDYDDPNAFDTDLISIDMVELIDEDLDDETADEGDEI